MHEREHISEKTTADKISLMLLEEEIIVAFVATTLVLEANCVNY